MFFVLPIVIFAFTNIYIILKIRNILKNKKSFFVFIFSHIFLCLIFFTEMFFKEYFTSENFILNFFGMFGYCYIIFFMYSFLIFILFDFIKIIFKIFSKIFNFSDTFKNFFTSIYARGIIVFVFSFLITAYSFINTSIIKIKEYDISINKDVANMDKINIVMISDTHIGTSVKEKQIDNIVEKINSINPDIICLCGDIFDESTTDELMEYAKDAFSKFNSKYGAFYVTGNHEFFSGHLDKEIEYIRNSKINVLRDDFILIDDSFYIVGRDDPMSRNNSNLADIMKDIDLSKPIIYLYHRPIELETAKELGVDLQVSGHTHYGQLFPINFLSGLSNEMNYGHYKSENYNIIVSSGVGTWGIPARFGSDCEIVSINAKFE